MDKKDFRGWHDLKSKMDDRHWRPLFHEQEIWWCSIGLNVGREEDGKNELFHRPVVVLKKFNSELFWALPITSKKKSGIFYASVRLRSKDQTALLSQLRVLSSKRLIRRIARLSEVEYKMLLVEVQMIFKKTDPPAYS